MMFQDQIVQKLIWRQNSRRKFRNSESTSLNIACTEFHVKTKHFEVLGPNVAKQSIFRMEFKKRIVKFRIPTLKYTCVESLI